MFDCSLVCLMLYRIATEGSQNGITSRYRCARLSGAAMTTLHSGCSSEIELPFVFFAPDSQYNRLKFVSIRAFGYNCTFLL